MRSPVALDTGNDGESGTGSDTAPSTPWWFEQALIVLCATVVAWGGAGVLLAFRAQYSLPRAALLGSLGTVLGIVFAWMRPRPRDRERVSARPTIAMCAGTGAIALWNIVYAGHHVTGDRDPGIYAQAGRWIAGHGSLVVPAGKGWPASVPAIALNSGGTFTTPGRTVQFQFAHFLPALLAEAQNIGGDRLMYRTNALLGAAALLVLFAVGCRLCARPWLVVAAVLGLGVAIPELYTVRDTFSEPSTQLVLWGGIWLIVLAMEPRAGRRHLGIALLGGAALGATVMTRIDGVAYFVFVPLLAAVGWITRSPSERRALLETYAAIAIGAIPAIAIGTLDVQRRSAAYYNGLHHEVVSLYAACAAMVVVALVIVVLWPRSDAIRDAVARYRARVATIAAGVAVAGLVLAWAVRPAVQKLRWPASSSSLPYIDLNSTLQKQEGLFVDGLRTYGERSVEWLSWYLGPVMLGLAIVGLAVVVWRVIRRPSPALAVPLLIAGSLSAEYLWNPHVNGDQPWAMRRFVPAVLPLCALLAALGLAVVCDTVQRARPRLAVGVLAAAGAGALIVFPLGTAIPVRALTVDHTFPAAVEEVCSHVGSNAAILVTPLDADTLYAQSFRDWCDVPVAGLVAPVDRATLASIAQSWKQRGRTLWIVADKVASLRGLVPAPQRIAAANDAHEVEITLARVPQQYVSKSVTFWGGRF